MERKENVVLLGPSGAGKSHPAVSLGQLAEPKDLKTRFVTAADLMLQLSAAKVQDKLESYLRRRVLTPELSIAI
ncbi:ATP-binding protein [Vibrio aestuarianus]|uniref:ATP-binding protein n=1 Tax=Vibrio aestuarianus TaxID=28171 RepID=UPI00237D3298|nr:ATP-binding protein [Vibrio aestuarianus]MDE1233049.1 ATP-binding protein [Vibrio aestuarianus]MDE1327023.1 ATP-binding protein [Vibrio aestuarianus]